MRSAPSRIRSRYRRVRRRNRRNDDPYRDRDGADAWKSVNGRGRRITLPRLCFSESAIERLQHDKTCFGAHAHPHNCLRVRSEPPPLGSGPVCKPSRANESWEVNQWSFASGNGILPILNVTRAHERNRPSNADEGASGDPEDAGRVSDAERIAQRDRTRERVVETSWPDPRN